MDLRQIYRRQQTFVFFFAVALALVGATLLIFPGNDLSLIAAGVPPWARYLDHAGYLAGGVLLTIGIYRTQPGLEAAGHILVSSLFVVAAIIGVEQAKNFGQAAASLGFLGPLTLGSAMRAFLLIQLTSRPASEDR